jgi:hypothetical protein
MSAGFPKSYRHPAPYLAEQAGISGHQNSARSNTRHAELKMALLEGKGAKNRFAMRFNPLVARADRALQLRLSILIDT